MLDSRVRAASLKFHLGSWHTSDPPTFPQPFSILALGELESGVSREINSSSSSYVSRVRVFVSASRWAERRYDGDRREDEEDRSRRMSVDHPRFRA